jgi:hypothetical protein
MNEELIMRLRFQSNEISSLNHAGWGNTMIDAAIALESLMTMTKNMQARLDDKNKEINTYRRIIANIVHECSRNDRVDSAQVFKHLESVGKENE